MIRIGYVLPRRLESLSQDVLDAISRSLVRGLGPFIDDTEVAVCPFDNATFVEVRSPPFPQHPGFQRADELELPRVLGCEVWEIFCRRRDVLVYGRSPEGERTGEWVDSRTDKPPVKELSASTGIDFESLVKRPKVVNVQKLRPDAALQPAGARD